MNSVLSPCDVAADVRPLLRERAAALGIARIGFAAAAEVDSEATAIYDRWIARGRHGEMDYAARYADVRRDPRRLLEGAQTIVSCAVAYPAPPPQPAGTLRFASYSLGDDYHHEVRRMLFELAKTIVDTLGGEVRVCVDTAPLRERYWAVQAGVGFIGINNQLIIPGLGSRFFLGEIITTAGIAPDEPCTLSCHGCGACVRACPGHALDGEGGLDCLRCHSYLTIEHRGDLPEDFAPADRIYGCDVCQNVCPHNREAAAVAVVDALQPRAAMLSLTPDALRAFTSGDYRRLSRRSAISRAPLRQLLRNLEYIDMGDF